MRGKANTGLTLESGAWPCYWEDLYFPPDQAGGFTAFGVPEPEKDATRIERGPVRVCLATQAI